jgi:hypothetical protein
MKDSPHRIPNSLDHSVDFSEDITQMHKKVFFSAIHLLLSSPIPLPTSEAVKKFSYSGVWGFKFRFLEERLSINHGELTPIE